MVECKASGQVSVIRDRQLGYSHSSMSRCARIMARFLEVLYMTSSGRSFVVGKSIPMKMMVMAMSALIAITIPLILASQQKTAYADTTSDLATVQAQADAANTKLLDVANQLTVANDELYDVQSQQADVTSQIADMQQQVDEAQAEYDTAMDSLKKQAVQNYTSDQVDYIAVLLDSSSFSDFATRLYLVDKMMSQQQDTINAVTVAKADLETKQADLQAQKDQLDTLEAAAQEKSTTIQTTLDEQTSYLAGLSSEVTTLMAQQAAEQAAASAAAATTAAAAISTSTGSSSNNASASSSTSSSSSSSSSSSGSSSSGDSGSSGSSSGSYSGSVGEQAAQAALTRVGNSTYSSSGSNEGPWVFDCSGLVTWAYAQAGVGITHQSTGQYNACSYHFSSSSELQVGDLVFYTRGSSFISHVAIYVGGGQVVEALSVGQGIVCEGIYSNGLTFVSFGRL